MRYLVFGDVHANLVALKAVLGAAERRRVDAYLFVGDLVGYGPHPLECIRLLKPLHDDQRLAWVAGNHDLAARGEEVTDHFSAEAKETLDWTQTLLGREEWALKFLAGSDLLSKVHGGIWLTHDSLADPASGTYHRATENAQREFAELAKRQGRICFYGHTHTMRAEVQAGEMVSLAPMAPCLDDPPDPTPLRLGAGERAWVGTGSAGFPTRQKGEAEYLVFDDKQWWVEKYAVGFSREEAKRQVTEVLGPVCSRPVVDRIARWL